MEYDVKIIQNKNIFKFTVWIKYTCVYQMHVHVKENCIDVQIGNILVFTLFLFYLIFFFFEIFLFQVPEPNNKTRCFYTIWYSYYIFISWNLQYFRFYLRFVNRFQIVYRLFYYTMLTYALLLYFVLYIFFYKILTIYFEYYCNIRKSLGIDFLWVGHYSRNYGHLERETKSQ